MTGVAIGAAMAGMRPIHVHIRMDFLMLCMNQIVNIASKARYMYGGQVKVPMVVRSIIGKSWGQGAQHSQALHSLFMHLPGMKVAAIARPPVWGGKVVSVDGAEALKVPGVERIVRIPETPIPGAFLPLGGVAVVAKNTWAALRGRDALKISWDAGPNCRPRNTTMPGCAQRPTPRTSAAGDRRT
jgi:hypothetical protein